MATSHTLYHGNGRSALLSVYCIIWKLANRITPSHPYRFFWNKASHTPNFVEDLGAAVNRSIIISNTHSFDVSYSLDTRYRNQYNFPSSDNSNPMMADILMADITWWNHIRINCVFILVLSSLFPTFSCIHSAEAKNSSFKESIIYNCSHYCQHQLRNS